ncbi:hypothetical protein IPJ72_04080 [Candidatus Peregrinibacteria bacterium]|nr:MAG: hypothetical protein IPJ72_04080 [Candidatus Peregrinibacteria bacterium]
MVIPFSNSTAFFTEIVKPAASAVAAAAMPVNATFAIFSVDSALSPNVLISLVAF